MFQKLDLQSADRRADFTLQSGSLVKFGTILYTVVLENIMLLSESRDCVSSLLMCVILCILILLHYSYTITVIITDGSFAKSAKIMVHITNVNDNDPSLTCV